MGNGLSQKENVHNGHRERVRQNVAKNGFSQLEDHRLLELLLFYCIPRGDTNEIAHSLLNEFGSLSGVVSASKNELSRIKGVGEAVALFLNSLGELNFRMMNEPVKKHKEFNTLDSLFELSRSLYYYEKVEKTYVLCFNERMKLIDKVLLSEGDFCSTEVNPRDLSHAVLSANAKFAVLVHNHPFSSEKPSVSDIDVTRSSAYLLRRIGVALFDHIIVGEDGSCYAMSSDRRWSYVLDRTIL